MPITYKRIWLALPIEYEYSRQIVLGVQRFVAETENWQPYTSCYLSEFDQHPHLLKAIFADFQGVIAFAPSEHFLELAKTLNIPMVNISGRFDSDAVPSVVPDNVEVGRIGAEHLLGTNIQHFAFVDEVHAYATLRSKGFADAIHAAGRHVHRWPRHGLEALLRDCPKPFGIMTPNDNIARDVIQICQRLGLSVPSDVAILGVDNDATIADLVRPRLSSIDINGQRVGYEAAVTLSKMLAGEPVQMRKLIRPVGVIARQSTDALMVDDPDIRAAIAFIRDPDRRALIGVNDVAKHVAISRRSLERRFILVVGHGPGEEIRRTQMNRAKHLLAATDLSVTEIAHKLGYSSPKRFSASFTELVRISPRQYRSKMGH